METGLSIFNGQTDNDCPAANNCICKSIADELHFCSSNSYHLFLPRKVSAGTLRSLIFLCSRDITYFFTNFIVCCSLPSLSFKIYNPFDKEEILIVLFAAPVTSVIV